MYVKYFSVAALVLVTACGSNLKPLTDAEKTETKAVMRAMGATALGLMKTSGTDKGAGEALTRKLDKITDPSGTQTRDLEKLQEDVKQAIREGRCEQISTIPSSPQLNGGTKARFVLSGANCPVTMALDAVSEIRTGGSSVAFHLTFKINEAAGGTPIGDLTSGEINGAYETSFVMQSFNPDDVRAITKFDVNGTCVSKVHGSFRTYLKGDIEMSRAPHGEIRYGTEVAGKAAEIRGTLEGQEWRYYINNVPMSPNELEDWF